MGAVYSIKLKKRIIYLENTLMMLHEMKINIEYLNMPVCEMIYKMKSKDYFAKLEFLSECCKAVKEGRDFPEAWKTALEISNYYYKSEETDKLLHLGANLGTSDLENQIKILNIHTEYFENYLKKAKSTQQKYGNMIFGITSLAGCMIFIMAI